jgi:hypothetical protein
VTTGVGGVAGATETNGVTLDVGGELEGSVRGSSRLALAFMVQFDGTTV